MYAWCEFKLQRLYINDMNKHSILYYFIRIENAKALFKVIQKGEIL